MAVPLQFSGALEEIPLPDIARLFQSTRKTGRLGLRSGKSTGAIFFTQGELVDCQSMNMSGLDAIKHVALFNRGTFEFIDGATTASATLSSQQTSELIRVLEARMEESRQLQELVPAMTEIPRYLGGAVPADFEVSAADLAVSMKASSGILTVRQLVAELNLDETMVAYSIARFRAVGLMEIVGKAETPSSTKKESTNSSVSDESPEDGYWRGWKIE